MSYNYEITLKPLEPFFFGGEFTFGADDSRSKKEASRYSATSTEFPQQTALLGMLRKTMLIQNEHLTIHKRGEWVDSRGRGHSDENYNQAKALVGSQSFSYDRDIDLGIITSISPIFIKEKDELFVTNAKDDGLELKEIKAKLSFGNGIKKAFCLDGFNAKEYSSKAFISPNGVKKDYEDFFETVEQVGIKKAKESETNEDGFFKKQSYKSKQGACFSFILTVKEPLNWKKTSIVSLGADQSSFKLEVKESKEQFDEIFKDIYPVKKISRIVLASETLINQEAYEKALFVLGKRKIYRQLTDARSGKKSKRYYLFEKGSVLYTEDIDGLDDLLNKEYLQAIGINKYFKIKGEN